MKFVTNTVQALYSMFFSAFNTSPLEEAKMELRSTELALLQAETVKEDYNSKTVVYSARIARLREYIRTTEAATAEFPPIHHGRRAEDRIAFTVTAEDPIQDSGFPNKSNRHYT